MRRNGFCFYDRFVTADEADVEDLFEKQEYLRLFNAAFDEHDDVALGDLDVSIDRTVAQLNKHLGVQRFNHYRPANQFSQIDRQQHGLSPETLDRFEAVFDQINGLFD